MSRDQFSSVFCLIVSGPADSGILEDDGQLRDLYDQVKTELQRIDSSILDSIDTFDGSMRELSVPVTGSKRTAALLFYEAKPQRGDDPSGRATEVADAINRAILDARGKQTHFAGADIRWVAAFPDHSAKATQIGSNGNGIVHIPEPVPEPPPDDYGDFQFPDNPDLDDAVRNPDPEPNVNVALLDTWPQGKESDYDKNRLLKKISATTKGAEPAIRVAPGPSIQMVHSSLGDVSDHGLFNTGIIRSIAATAPIRAIRILNDNGAGDVGSVFRGLQMLRQENLLGGGLLVLNLSWRFQHPAGQSVLDGDEQRAILARVIQELLLELSDDDRTKAEAFAASILDSGTYIYEVFLEMLFWMAMSAHEVLIVAAAGNDGPDATGAPQPAAAPARYSANFESMNSLLDNSIRCRIVGVAACNSDASAASHFTNRGDLTTMGGDVNPGGYDPIEPSKNQPATRFGRPDAIVGVGIGSPTGWLRASGTSHAAAIMSGIAAAIAAPNRITTAVRLREALDAFRGPTQLVGLGSQAIKVTQTR